MKKFCVLILLISLLTACSTGCGDGNGNTCSSNKYFVVAQNIETGEIDTVLCRRQNIHDDVLWVNTDHMRVDPYYPYAMGYYPIKYLGKRDCAKEPHVSN